MKHPINHRILLIFPFIYFCLTGCVKEENRIKTEKKEQTVAVPPATQFEVVPVQGSYWDESFTSRNVTGTFALWLPEVYQKNQFLQKLHNPDRAATPYIPASTFKIPNSLIMLEEGAVKDENEVLKWDGTKRFYDMWNQDLAMKDALKFSAVWFYQEGARRVGKQRMQYWLDEIEYGNQEMGAAVDSFWLVGTTAISALQQLEFLHKFEAGMLPFDQQNQETVKRILLVDSTKTMKMRAKTGWGLRNGSDIGWFVGWVEKAEKSAFFALNIDMPDDSMTPFRKEIAREILRKEGWWE